MHDDGQRLRRRVTIRGRVQGVFFRDSAREQAQAHGVSGWVANRPDGSVEAVLEGTRDGIDGVLRFLKSGPPRANVETVDVSEEAPEGLSGFEVR